MESLSILVMNWRDIRNPEAGGAEVYTHEVARRLVKWGHQVTLLTSGFPGGLREELVDDVRIVRVGDKLSVYRRARSEYQDRFRKQVGLIVDEINTRPFLTPRFVDGGTPLFAFIHQLAREFWFYETPFPVNIVGRYWLEPRWLRNYRRIPTLTVSPSTKQELLGLEFRDVTVVPNGLSMEPLSQLPHKDPEPTLIYVGRFKKAKLPDHAVRAFLRVKRKLPNARLWMVGDGYMRPRLERRYREGVVFFGNVPEEQKVELLRRAHVVLYPAVREGWGRTVLEANGLGTPAVGYDVPGLRDSIRNRDTGFLVPFGDIEGLAQCASSLLRDDGLRTEMAQKALEWSRGFSWERTAQEFLAWLTGKR